MGRPKGAKNKSTVYREMKQRALVMTAEIIDNPTDPGDEAEILAVNGADYIDQSLIALGEALGVILTMARREKDQDKRRGLYQDVTVIADKLAPYRYPRLASIHTNTSKQTALQRSGATEREVYAEVMAEVIAGIRESGELPRAVQAYLTNGGGSNGGGTGKIGGVANRNAD
jgi:hypothetical protein